VTMSNAFEWNLSNVNRRRLFGRRRHGFPRSGFLFGLMALGGTMMGAAAWEEMKYVAAADSQAADAGGAAAPPTLITSLADAREGNAGSFAVLRDVVPSSPAPAESGGADEPPRAEAPSAATPSATAPGAEAASGSPQPLDGQPGGIPALAFPRMMVPAVRARPAPQTEAAPAAVPEPRKAASRTPGHPASPKAAHVTPHAPARGAAPAEGAFRVQLASVRTEADGRRMLESLRRTHGRVLDLYRLSLARADVDGRGTVFRVQAGPMADHRTAAGVCQELRRRNADCLVILSGAGE
jgi:sporulation related protein